MTEIPHDYLTCRWKYLPPFSVRLRQKIRLRKVRERATYTLLAQNKGCESHTESTVIKTNLFPCVLQILERYMLFRKDGNRDYLGKLML